MSQGPGFILLPTPGILAMPAGSTARIQVTLTRLRGFQGPVALALEGAPSGISWSGSIAAGENAGVLTLQVAGAVAPQVLPGLRLVGQAGAGTQAAALQVTVTQPLPTGQIHPDAALAPGGTQRGGPWVQTVCIQEPAAATPGSAGALQNRPGFDPSGSPR